MFHNVTIIGAGLGGLTLAWVLHVQGISAIAAHPEDIEATLAVHEQAMFPRVRQKQRTRT